MSFSSFKKDNLFSSIFSYFKLFESQLSQAQVRRDTIAKRIDNMNDSITKLDIDILNMESKEMSGSELGALKYVSELLDWDIKRTANLFILILIIIFAV